MRAHAVRGRCIRAATPAVLAALMACPVLCGESLPPASPGVRADAPIDANRPFAQELQSSAAPGLVIAVAGSVSIDSPQPALPAWDPGVVGLLTGKAFPETSTVAVADLHSTLLDPLTFSGYPYPWEGERAYSAPVAVAAELKHQGLAMLALANGHALDWGTEGMRATSAALDAAGIKHAGSGEREGLARAASYLEEPTGKGRIALLATATHFRPTTNALSEHGAAPSRPGISAIEFMPLHRVGPQQLAQLQRVACRFQHPEDRQHCDQSAEASQGVSLFGSRFALADSTELYSSEADVNQVHLANELRAVREAKQNSDLLVVSVYDGGPELSSSQRAPAPKALIQLAHAMIEAGADLVMVSGARAPGPIEIYRPLNGPPRPILYGIAGLYSSADLASVPDRPEDKQSIIVRTGFGAGGLSLEIYPIDLHSAGAPIGVPRLASAAQGGEILEQIRRLSAPFHTVIRTEPYGDTVRGRVVLEAGSASTGTDHP